MIYKDKFYNLVFLAIILLFLISPQISALGISPGRTTIDFEPGLEKTIKVNVVNTENKEMGVVLYAKGELKDIITFSEDTLLFSADEKEKTFTYSLKLPESMSRPGLYTGEIIALEVPPEGVKEGAVIGATVAVTTQLYVNVPYPGKYIEFDLDILEKEGEVSFYIPVINKGEEDINELGSSIEIYSGTDKIKEIDLEKISIESEKREELIAKWADATPGNYLAKLILNYDSEEEILEKNFKVGNVKIEILSITVDDFSLGEIAKFNILVENKWREEIKDVSVNMIIYGNSGETIADFTTANYNLLASDRVNMNSYWDTENVNENIYDGKLTLRYENEEESRNIRIKVTKDSIEVLGLTGYVIDEGGGELNLVNLLLIIVGLLVIANIIWFVVVKKLKNKK
jgi:hypothetical protein